MLVLVLVLVTGILSLAYLYGAFPILLFHTPRPVDSDAFSKLLGSLRLSRQEVKEATDPVARSSVWGFYVGVLTGAGATVASFLAYITEKRIAKDGNTFGQGNIKGVAAPETAKNAAYSDSFMPLLTLGA